MRRFDQRDFRRRTAIRPARLHRSGMERRRGPALPCENLIIGGRWDRWDRWDAIDPSHKSHKSHKSHLSHLSLSLRVSQQEPVKAVLVERELIGLFPYDRKWHP